MRHSSCALLLLGLVACSHQAPWTPSIERGEAAPPEIPWLADGVPAVAPPALTPCPSGWLETTDADGVAFCDAYGPSGHQTCAADAAHFPGERGCRQLGPACDPTDPFPAGLPSDRVIVYVLAGAAAGGDGSRDHPYTSLTTAIDAAPDASVVAVGRGTYDDAPLVTRSIDIVGACVAETLVAPTVPGGPSVSIQRGVGGAIAVNVSGLTFTGIRGGIEVVGAASVGVREVAFASYDGTAIWVDGAGARVTVDDVVVRDARDTERSIPGMLVREGGALTAQHVVFEDTVGSAVEAVGEGSIVTLEDAAFFGGTQSSLIGQQGGTLTLRRAHLTSDATVTAQLAGTIVVEDVALVGPSDLFPIVALGGVATLRRVRVERAICGISAVGFDTMVDAEDVLIRDTHALSTGQAGLGLTASGGAVLDVRRVRITRVLTTALAVSDPGTSLTLTDAWIDGVSAPPIAVGYGSLLYEWQGGRSVLTRVVGQHFAGWGVYCGDASSRLEATDLVVRDVGLTTDGRLGDGVMLWDAHGRLSRVVVERVHGSGVSTWNGDLDVEDVVIRDVAPWGCDGSAPCNSGVGLGVGWGRLDASRFSIERAARSGVGVYYGVDTTLADGRISGTPVGLSASYLAELTTTRLQIEDDTVDAEMAWLVPY